LILLDTNVVLWLAFEPERISKTAAMAIREERKIAEGLAVSSITLLEIAVLTTKNRVTLDLALEVFLRDIESNFAIMGITSRACARIPELPAGCPKDPADRIIAATALAEGMALVTADREIRRIKELRTVW
jgi:PIN domain nuclease of toxin-antitoxin system